MKLKRTAAILAAFIAAIMLTSCSSTDIIGGADSATDMVIMHGILKQAGNWDKFLASVQSGTASEISIVNYTVEGDPIIDYVKYDGQEFYLKRDNSHDKFSDGKDFEASYSRLDDLSDDNKVCYCLTNTPDGHNIGADAWTLVSYTR